MDFLSDQLFEARKIRILTIVDTFSKLSPAPCAFGRPALTWWRP
jgi:hypothetical protein